MIAQAGHKFRIFALTITVLGLISACGSQPLERRVEEQSSRSVSMPRSIGEKAAAIALQQVGVPYRYGGSTTSGFDCSGLVQFAYGKAGKHVARTTAQQWSSTETVASRDLQVGDLLFFRIAGKMSHVGMYIGGQRFVHAPSSGRTVTVANLNSEFYSAALMRAGRPR